MHISVIEANNHRSLERKRMQANRVKRRAKAVVVAFGLNPSFTPCTNPDGNARQRRLASRPHRQMKRQAKQLMIAYGICLL